MEQVLAFVFLGAAVWIIWTLFVIVGDMAEARGQTRLLWQVAALFLNPFGAMIILWLFCAVKDNEAE